MSIVMTGHIIYMKCGIFSIPNQGPNTEFCTS